MTDKHKIASQKTMMEAQNEEDIVILATRNGTENKQLFIKL
ncbi:MAG: hypothetical protein ACRD8W_01960 [Nitrososphaeraceae archaeon]